MNTQYTSLELSRDLQEAGFSQLRISKYWYELVPYDDESDCFRELLEDIPQWYRKEFYDITKIPAYDILWDLCVRYSQEVWGELSHYGVTVGHHFDMIGYDKAASDMIILLQQGKHTEAEQYIRDHSILFKK